MIVGTIINLAIFMHTLKFSIVTEKLRKLLRESEKFSPTMSSFFLFFRSYRKPTIIRIMEKMTETRLFEYFNGDLPSGEEMAVREWAHSSDENRRLFEEARKDYLRLRWGSRASLIKGYANIKRPAVRRSVVWRRMAVAAVLLPAMVFGAYWMLGRGSSGGEEPVQVQLPKSEVVLVTSDGMRYVVDAAANSSVREKDGTQVSITDGKIVYDKEKAEKELIYNRVIIPRGATPYKVELDDGSAVWLNAGSELEYPVHFVGEDRRVILTGEGFFDVVKDEVRPFVVDAGGQSLMVLGTEFNISSYPQEPVVTTLVSGKVSLRPDGDSYSEEVILLPGQQTSFDSATGYIQIATVNVNHFISWRSGMLNVDQMTLAGVLKKVERKYDVTFDLSEADVEGIVLKGSISEEAFETVQSILEKAANVEFKMIKDGVIKVTNR